MQARGNGRLAGVVIRQAPKGAKAKQDLAGEGAGATQSPSLSLTANAQLGFVVGAGFAQGEAANFFAELEQVLVLLVPFR